MAGFRPRPAPAYGSRRAGRRAAARPAQPPSPELRDAHRAPERVLGRGAADRDGGAQARTQVAEPDRPGAGRPFGGQQEAQAALAAAIVEVQEPPLAGAVGVVDRDPGRARLDQRRQAGLVEPLPGEREAARMLAPEMDEVGLAASRRSVQHQGSGRPVGPAVEPGNRRLVAWRDQEIGAAERGAARKGDRQLAHATRKRMRKTSFPIPHCSPARGGEKPRSIVMPGISTRAWARRRPPLDGSGAAAESRGRVRAGIHRACSERAMIRAQRTRYDSPEAAVVAATA